MSTAPDVANHTLASDTAEAVELLQRLVRAPSPNPPGDERVVQEVARSYLEAIPGVTVEDHGVSPSRPMLVARLPGARPGRTIVFGGHVDTVPTGDGWTRDPFGGEVEAGRLYGRGASDMKGGVAGMLVALRRIAQAPRTWAGEVVVHVVPDEEPGGQQGAELLLRRGLLVADAAIITEPSELCVYRAQKGNIFAAARVHGRSAHGSMPERGDNAISRAARLIVDLEERLSARIGDRVHPLLGPATLSVGTIAGGRRTNVVPDECVVTIDRRVVPQERLDAAVAELEEFIGDRAQLTVEHAGAAFDTAESHWVVRAAVDAVGAVRGAAMPIGGLVGSSDARYYADGAGIPTIIVGPGSMTQAHVRDEWVDVRLLGQSVEVYRRIAMSLLGDAEDGEAA
jgi:acetylornithine deacetylase/succinyl-diaminopimelate desuccinylase family protein